MATGFRKTRKAGIEKPRWTISATCRASSGVCRDVLGSCIFHWLLTLRHLPAMEGTTGTLQAPSFQLSSECPSVMKSNVHWQANSFQTFSPCNLRENMDVGIIVLLLTEKINLVYGCSFLTYVSLAVFTKYAHRVNFKKAVHSSQRAGFVINQILD